MITALPRIAIAMRDFDDAVDLFRDVLGLPVADFSPETVPSLGAHVGMCMPVGGSNIELMAPSNPDLALSQSLDKFLQHRGEGFYALMLEAPVPDDEAEELLVRGIDVLPLMKGAGGRDLHPRSTHGVLIRVYPNDSVGNPSVEPAKDPSVSGIVRVIIATNDVHAACKTYGTGLGLDVGPVVNDAERGLDVAVCTPPKGGVIELVQVTDPTNAFGASVAAQLEARGEGIYALVLEADDPSAVLDKLADHDISATDGAVELFGARIIVEARH